MAQQPEAVYSERALRALGMFGLTARDVGLDATARVRRDERARALAARIDGVLEARGVCVVLGPSGAGKSTVLGVMAHAAAARGERLVRVRAWAEGSRERVVDVLKGPLESDLRMLALCGMGDARLAITPLTGLSEGERARLGLARAMIECDAAAGQGPVLLVADEFGAALDAVTARAVARGLGKFVRARARVRAVVVSSREEVCAELRARVVVQLRSGWIHGA